MVNKRLYSRRDDVTLADPFGPPVRGWSEVSTALDRAAANYRDGEVVGFENVTTIIGSDLADAVEVESYRARVGRSATDIIQTPFCRVAPRRLAPESVRVPAP